MDAWKEVSAFFMNFRLSNSYCILIAVLFYEGYISSFLKEELLVEALID